MLARGFRADYSVGCGIEAGFRGYSGIRVYRGVHM